MPFKLLHNTIVMRVEEKPFYFTLFAFMGAKMVKPSPFYGRMLLLLIIVLIKTRIKMVAVG